jgi:hypothetical protein
MAAVLSVPLDQHLDEELSNPKERVVGSTYSWVYLP